jgi:hypothetical protein
MPARAEGDAGDDDAVTEVFALGRVVELVSQAERTAAWLMATNVTNARRTPDGLIFPLTAVP